MGKLQASRVTGHNKSILSDVYVVGDAEHVIASMLASEDLRGWGRKNFQVESIDEIYLDPGGMLKMEKSRNFSIEGVNFSIYPHKAELVIENLNSADSESVPGYVSIVQGIGSRPYFVVLTLEMTEALLCALMAMSLEEEVRQSRDEALDLLDRAFLEGKVARPLPGGGFGMVREVREYPEEDEEPEGLGFTVPEGIDPF